MTEFIAIQRKPTRQSVTVGVGGGCITLTPRGLGASSAAISVVQLKDVSELRARWRLFRREVTVTTKHGLRYVLLSKQGLAIRDSIRQAMAGGAG